MASFDITRYNPKLATSKLIHIPDRIRQFLKYTNSFGVIIEEGKPTYILASFDWAERMLLGLEEETAEEANEDFSIVAKQSSEGDLASGPLGPTTQGEEIEKEIEKDI